MHALHRKGSARAHQRGLSLIELMVAITLGLFLLTVTISVFLGISRTARTQDAASRLDENGRFAIESITRAIRLAGYRNWGGPGGAPGYTGTGDPVINATDGTAATTGYSDTINVRFHGAGPAVGTADGSIVDCLGNPVAEGSTLADRVVNTFTVAASGSERVLTCDNGTGAVTLATNIDSLQILYGVDISGGDRVADRWVRANDVANWDQVVAVRVSLMAVGEVGSRGLAADTATYRMFDENYVNTSDNGAIYNASADTSTDARSRLRKVYTTTIFLRNRTFASAT
ncbi:MAG TPA: PilW family protein [Burkholderiaceae bacterium]|nr:PilW family protein [Burkholderiaceae bacterium]